MDALSKEEALLAIEQVSAGNGIKETDIAPLINDSDALCEIVTASKVKTAAAHKDLNIYKVSKSQVLLPISGDTYRDLVRESALANGAEQESVDNYVVGESPYQHTGVYPICELKSNPEKKYLYGIYGVGTAPVYMLDDTVLTKEEVAGYMTAGEAKKLLDETPAVTENKTHGFKHSVAVRTVSLGNVISLKRV